MSDNLERLGHAPIAPSPETPQPPVHSEGSSSGLDLMAYCLGGSALAAAGRVVKMMDTDPFTVGSADRLGLVVTLVGAMAVGVGVLKATRSRRR